MVVIKCSPSRKCVTISRSHTDRIFVICTFLSWKLNSHEGVRNRDKFPLLNTSTMSNKIASIKLASSFSKNSDLSGGGERHVDLYQMKGKYLKWLLRYYYINWYVVWAECFDTRLEVRDDISIWSGLNRPVYFPAARGNSGRSEWPSRRSIRSVTVFNVNLLWTTGWTSGLAFPPAFVYLWFEYTCIRRGRFVPCRGFFLFWCLDLFFFQSDFLPSWNVLRKGSLHVGRSYGRISKISRPWK